MNWDFDAIGTHWRITTPVLIGSEEKTSIIDRIEAFDWSYSRFRNDGLIAGIRETVGTHVLPDDAEPLINFYRRLYDVTGGGITPLIGRTLEQLGYDADYSLNPGETDSLPSWGDALAYHHPVLEVKQAGLVLDFGAAGKGYLVDIVADMLRACDHHEFVINAGGDITVRGESRRIELEDPHDTSRSIGFVELKSGQSICASATSRRRWRNLHHVIDPNTLLPTDTIVASWVIADSCMMADGLATALWFSNPAKLLRTFPVEYLLIKADQIQSSSQFGARLYTGETA
ncbi:FAD:protein FMN transferase [Candidatus Saccharibacteria bacterium]|nr:FAD:protein FMN transferase [Candidatus Saccharibacteria bacterium]